MRFVYRLIQIFIQIEFNLNLEFLKNDFEVHLMRISFHQSFLNIGWMQFQK